MNIRRFKWNSAKWDGWSKDHLYAEFHDGVMQFIATADGGTTKQWMWSLEDAEVFVGRNDWVEIGAWGMPQEPGDWPEDFGHESGNYQNFCVASTCSKPFMGHKRRLVCKECVRAGKAVQDRSSEIAAGAAPTLNKFYPLSPDLAKMLQARATAASQIVESVLELRVNGELVTIRTMDSAELFQHFRNFRHAQMGVTGLGRAYPDALEFINNQVAIRVAEVLKALQ